jgi:hypothetical protein
VLEDSVVGVGCAGGRRGKKECGCLLVALVERIESFVVCLGPGLEFGQAVVFGQDGVIWRGRRAAESGPEGGA